MKKIIALILVMVLLALIYWFFVYKDKGQNRNESQITSDSNNLVKNEDEPTYELTDGTHKGYIYYMDNNKIEFDPIDWKVDEGDNLAATEACIEGGECNRTDCTVDGKLLSCTGNGYYIVNKDNSKAVINLTVNTEYTFITRDYGQDMGSRNLPQTEFIKLVNERIDDSNEAYKSILYDIEIVDSNAVSIREFYTP